MTPPLAEPPFDRDVVMNRVGGDRDLLNEVVQLFLADAPILVAQVRKAIGGGDAPALERAAHTLKGLVANFSVTAAVAASQLENMARQKNLAEAHESLQQVEHQVSQLTAALQALIREAAA